MDEVGVGVDEVDGGSRAVHEGGTGSEGKRQGGKLTPL